MRHSLRQSKLFSALTRIILCVWLAFVVASAVGHVHAHKPPIGRAQAALTAHDDGCLVCQWLDILHQAVFPPPSIIVIADMVRLEPPAARLPDRQCISLRSTSRGPPLSAPV
ncbi:MAG TPA: hypothetical protein VKU00_18690 [Chthonomonadaceae bacterium]|nr:hypothetical protein [Chthonomonadaceae bacterium]